MPEHYEEKCLEAVLHRAWFPWTSAMHRMLSRVIIIIMSCLFSKMRVESMDSPLRKGGAEDNRGNALPDSLGSWCSLLGVCETNEIKQLKI